MTRTWNATLRYSALLVSVLLISACAAKLIDLDKSLPMLNLSEEQREVVKPKMEAIKEIADTYDIEKEEFEEEINSSMEEAISGGDRSQFQAKFQEFRSKREDFLKRREAYLSAIRIHTDDIKSVLNEDQLAAFEKMEMPELEVPDMPMDRRGGRGGGPGGRGGMGGRGGRPGGGMF